MAIKHRRGKEIDLDVSQLVAGEMAVCTDTGKVVVKLAGENYIVFADNESVNVIQNALADKAQLKHTHSMADITDYTPSEGDAAVTLFSFDDGDSTSETITLSDDVSNYSHIEVIYGTADVVSSAKVLSGQTVAMSITQSDADCFKLTTGTAALSGTQLTRGADEAERQLIINHATEGQLDFTGASSDSGYYIRIYRVIGYK